MFTKTKHFTYWTVYLSLSTEQYCHRCIQVEIQAIHIRMEDFLEYHLPGIQKYLNKNINWVNLLCKIKFHSYNQHCGSAKFWCGSAFEITDSDPLKDRCGSGSRSRCQWMIFVSIISLTLGFPSIYFRCWKEVLVLCNIFYIYWLKNGKKKNIFFGFFYVTRIRSGSVFTFRLTLKLIPWTGSYSNKRLFWTSISLMSIR